MLNVIFNIRKIKGSECVSGALKLEYNILTRSNVYVARVTKYKGGQIRHRNTLLQVNNVAAETLDQLKDKLTDFCDSGKFILEFIEDTSIK